MLKFNKQNHPKDFMSTKPEFELVPGVQWEPLFTPEQYEKFRQDWYETIIPELRELDRRRALDNPVQPM